MTDDRITTPEALDALPVGSVVLDGMGDAWQHSDADADWWAPANPFYAEADAANVLEQGGTEHPITLLYRPDRPSDLAVLRAGLGALAQGWDEEAGDYVPPLPSDTPWRLMVEEVTAVRALLASAPVDPTTPGCVCGHPQAMHLPRCQARRTPLDDWTGREPCPCWTYKRAKDGAR